MSKSLARSDAPPRVGIRIPAWHSYMRGIYPGIVAYLHEHSPWQLETTEDSTHEFPPTKIDGNWRGDGLIVFRCTASEVRAWRRRGIRVVNISSESPNVRGGDLPTVVPDNFAAGRLAAQHLLHRGLTRFAFWSDPARKYSRQRQEGFTAAIAAAGYEVEVIELAVSMMPIDKRWRAAEVLLRERLPKLQPPVGLFAKDDISAATVVRACHLVGLRVPEDVVVVGCNNDPAFVYTASPCLTSMVYPAEAIGYTAAKLLDRLLRNPSWQPSGPIRVPVKEIVQRESSAVYSFADPLVSGVWALLQQAPAAQPLQVHDLAVRLAVASSTLRRRFRSATGKSIKSAIDETRLNQIKQRLSQTEMPVKQVAYSCGFRTPEDMTRFVRRHTGTSPSHWRAERREEETSER